MPVSPQHLRDLHELFASIDTAREAKLLLEDILTPQEIAALAERWQLVQQLSAGKTQRKIAKDLKVSISKITRGSNMLKHGKGGFGHFLRKLKKSTRD